MAAVVKDIYFPSLLGTHREESPFWQELFLFSVGTEGGGYKALLEDVYVADPDGVICVNYDEIIESIIVPHMTLSSVDERITDTPPEHVCRFTLETALNKYEINVFPHPSENSSREMYPAEDVKRVPFDYVVMGYGTDFISAQGLKVGSKDYAHKSMLPLTDRMLRLAAIEDGHTAYGPWMKPEAKRFEQYAFFNPLGGYDNIPMDGLLEFIPDHTFENVVVGSRLTRLRSKEEKIWRQNSGFQSRKVIELLSELICSPHIYHLKDGLWKKIVVTSSSVTSGSRDNLHSMTFEYKYENL